MNNIANRLSNAQMPSGAFAGNDGQESVIITAGILLFLNRLSDDGDIARIKKGAGSWLLSKRNEQWLVDKNLGVNFLALTAVFENDKNIFDGTALAKILVALSSSEAKEGGPYFSELNSENKKIDLGVNAAIARFLFLHEVELPELTGLFATAMETKVFSSEIFADEYYVIYLLAGFYRGERADKLFEHVLAQIRGRHLDSPFDKLLAFVSLFHLGATPELLRESAEILNLAEILSNDNLNPIGEKNLFVTPELFLALCITANETMEKQAGLIKDETNGAPDDQEKFIMELILEKAEKRFANLVGGMKEIAWREITKTISQNPDRQMSLMPYCMKQALGKNGRKISDDTVAEMGLANIFYWTAFIIYDNFWDVDEEADPRTLPTANLYARHYSNFFHSLLPERTGFREFFRELMDNLDAANTWETTYCRTKVAGNHFVVPDFLPDYGDYEMKYRPASGHALGSAAMLYMLGYNEDSSEVKNLLDYFRYYLIAMQINDDAHDWEEDMARGHLSTVVVMLLEDFKQKYPGIREIDLVEDKESLRQIFWFKTIKRACETAVHFTNKSRLALHTMKTLENFAPLERYIDITEAAAQKALKEQKMSVEFLGEFKD
ncbi:MAG: hypothetical protein WC457_01880 [Patescibacteria group bacterium]